MVVTGDTRAAKEQEFHRNYLRVRASINVRLRLASNEEAAHARESGMVPSGVTRARIAMTEALTKSLDLGKDTRRVFEKFFELLISIDQKLDHLIGEKSELARGVLYLCDRNVDISGGGIYLDLTPEEIHTLGLPEIGAPLELELSIPSIPPNVILCYGEVRWIEGLGSTTGIGIAFSAISEDDRQEVVRFVTVRERAMLQARAGEKGKQ